MVKTVKVINLPRSFAPKKTLNKASLLLQISRVYWQLDLRFEWLSEGQQVNQRASLLQEVSYLHSFLLLLLQISLVYWQLDLRSGKAVLFLDRPFP